MVVQPSDADENAPVLLQDRTLSASVSLVAICPSMDLLAVVLDKVSVAIFRTTWQRLAAIPVCTQPDQHITSVAWSPDGANLAVATSAGDLSILSVDRSAFASTAKAKRAARETAGPIATISLPVPASCLSWVAAPAELCDESLGSGCHYEDRAAQLLQTTNESEPRSAGLIFCGDRDGFLSIMSQNLLFTIARLRVLSPGYSIVGLRLTPDLHQCLVFGQITPEEPSSPQTSTRAGEVHCSLRSVDLGPVLEFWPEISRIGREVVAITRFIRELETAAKQISECWVKGAGEITKSAVMDPLSKLMTDFAENRSKDPWEMLHHAFCGGSVNGAVLQFLAAELSENGAKEALRAFRSHVDDLSDTLHALVPVAENSVVRAFEYRALASLTSRYSPVGVHIENAEKLFDLAESLYWALGDITWEIEKVSKETEAFLAWLVIAAARAGGDSARGRSSSAMGNLKGEDGRLVSKFFLRVTSKRTAVECSHPRDTVTDMYNDHILPVIGKYRNLCHEMLAEPSVAISAILSIDEGVVFPMRALTKPGNPKFCITGFGAEARLRRYMHVCILTEEGNVISVQYEVTKRRWSLTHRGFLNEKLLIHDASAFENSRAAFLVSASPTRDAMDVGDSKLLCDLVIHELDTGDFSGKTVHVNMNQSDRNVCIPEVSQFGGQKLGVAEAGQVSSVGALSLSIDSTRRIAR